VAGDTEDCGGKIMSEMTEMTKWCKENKIRLTSDQKRAGDFLESKGEKMFVDFGFGNALSQAKRKYGFNPSPTKDTVNAAVLDILRKENVWWTPYYLCDRLIEDEIYISESSTTARLRDLRKPRYGAYTIEKRRIENSSAYEYRLKR